VEAIVASAVEPLGLDEGLWEDCLLRAVEVAVVVTVVVSMYVDVSMWVMT
jgi:hypothetical protein